MIKAIPINSKGEQVGEAKNFSDAQFNKMKAHFGKTFAWKEVEQEKEKIREVELIASISTKKAKRKNEK